METTPVLQAPRRSRGVSVLCDRLCARAVLPLVSSSKIPGTIITACGRFSFSNFADLRASARLTKRPPQLPCSSWTTQLPRLSLPIRKSEGLVHDCIEGGSVCFMARLLDVEWRQVAFRRLT